MPATRKARFFILESDTTRTWSYDEDEPAHDDEPIDDTINAVNWLETVCDGTLPSHTAWTRRLRDTFQDPLEGLDLL